jgi:hypothetical protein
LIFRRLLEYKSQIAHELERCRQLKIKRTRAGESDTDDGDSDFEDVVKEDLELDFPALDFSEPDQTKVNTKIEDEAGPSGLQPGTSKEDRGPKIPKLSYGLDLKYWGQKVEPAMLPRNEFDGHPFWRASDPG